MSQVKYDACNSTGRLSMTGGKDCMDRAEEGTELETSVIKL